MNRATDDRIHYHQPTNSSKDEYNSYYDRQLAAGEEFKDVPSQDIRTSIGKEEKKASKSIWTSPSNNFSLFYYQQSKTPDKSPYKDVYEGSERTSNKTADRLEDMVEQWNRNFHLGDSSP